MTVPLVDTLEQRFEELMNSFHSVGTVTAVNSTRATVDIAGGEISVGYPVDYMPFVGDVVQVIGRPGAKFIVCRLGFDTAQYRTANPLRVSGNINADGEIRANLGIRAEGGLSTGGDMVTAGDLTAQRYFVAGNAIRCVPYNGALRWATDGAMEITNRDGTDLRGVRTERLHANRVDSNGDIVAQAGLRANGGLSCGGDFVVGGRAKSTDWSSSIYDGALNWGSDGALNIMNFAGTAYRGVRSTNFVDVDGSWRWMKRDFHPLEEHLGTGPLDLISSLDICAYRYDPETTENEDCDEVQVGLMLDDLPEPMIERFGEYESLERPNAPGPDIKLDRDPAASWNTRKMLVVALAAIQEQQKQIESLTKRVEELESSRA